MTASGTVNQITAVCLSELNNATVKTTMARMKNGMLPARAAWASALDFTSPHHSSE